MTKLVSDDGRTHIESSLMRESLVDRRVIAKTSSEEEFAIMPDVVMVGIGGQSIFDRGKGAVRPLVEELRLLREGRKHKIILSVGGGNLEKNVSPNLVTALQMAKEVGAKVIGIVGKDGGYTAKVADACVIVPTVNDQHITPHAEAFQGVVWHLLVTHPTVKTMATKWESLR